MSKIPLLNLIKEHVPYQTELEDAVLSVLRGGNYILGKTVQDFEQSAADYLNCRYTLGVSSGTDALLLALMALNIGPGDEVICPAFTFFATAGSIARVGATPVFVDIYPDCFTIDVEAIESAITNKTKAIIPVHLFGQSADLDNLKALAADRNLYLIEDTAQSMGATYHNQQLGTIGDIGCFSFFPSKNLGGCGDGGLVATNNSNLARRMKDLRNHGMTSQYYHTLIGGNFRLDAMQAAILSVKLKYLDSALKKREKVAKTYLEHLKEHPGYELPKHVRGRHTWNQFTIRVKGGRSSLQEVLASKEISSAIYYPRGLHEQPCFTTGTSLPITEEACEEVLSIPVDGNHESEAVETIIATLSEF